MNRTNRESRVYLPMFRTNRFTAVLLVFTGILTTGCEKKKQAAATAAPDVEVVEVEQKDVPITREWVANLDGLVNAQIRAQVAGYLMKQSYTNGAYVKKGTPLFQIDPRPFQAALEQAKGNVEQSKGKVQQATADLAQAQGNLQRSQASLGKTELDVKRYTPLAKQSAISQQELDDAIQSNLAALAQVVANKAAIEAAQAAIDSAKATVLAAQAAVDVAQLNLSFTTIVSPIDGVTSISIAQVGDLLSPQSGALTTVSTVDPILVNFTPSEGDYLNTVRATGDSPAKEEQALKRLEFQLILTDGTQYAHKGRIYAINRAVDIRTGTILVQTSFPNPGSMLRPGGFGRITVVARIQKGAALVPQRAVADVQGTYLVAVVGSDNKVSMRPVKPGARVGVMWVIDEGLKPGERVVAEGIQKVRQGLVVNPKPYSASAEGAKTGAL
jgi:RND family efflux transporter MFP subunit